MLALTANKLGQLLGAVLANADALAVEPVVAQVAANVELAVIVRRAAQAEQFLLLARRRFGAGEPVGSTAAAPVRRTVVRLVRFDGGLVRGHRTAERNNGNEYGGGWLVDGSKVPSTYRRLSGLAGVSEFLA